MENQKCTSKGWTYLKINYQMISEGVGKNKWNTDKSLTQMSNVCIGVVQNNWVKHLKESQANLRISKSSSYLRFPT